jgi:hypothetical protein
MQLFSAVYRKVSLKLVAAVVIAVLMGWIIHNMYGAVPLSSPEHQGRNIVLTMAGGAQYGGADGEEWVARFGGSFRRVNEHADVVFFTSGVDASVESLAAAVRMTPHIFAEEPEPWGSMEVAARRWHMFREFLEARAVEYEGGWVLAIDARDAFFQRDPFAFPRMPGDEFYAVLEQVRNVACANDRPFLFVRNVAPPLQDITIMTSSWNYNVIEQCYSQEELAAVVAAPVSCSGTILASYAGMLEYLRAMEGEMLTPSALSPECLKTGGRDQGFHNVLVHSGRLAARFAEKLTQHAEHREGDPNAVVNSGVSLLTHEEGPIQTLQFGDLYIDRLGRVLNKRGDVSYVIHQFDRQPIVVERVKAMFPVYAQPVHPLGKRTDWTPAGTRPPARASLRGPVVRAPPQARRP